MPTHVMDTSRRAPTIPSPPVLIAIVVAVLLLASLVVRTSASTADAAASEFQMDGP